MATMRAMVAEKPGDYDVMQLRGLDDSAPRAPRGARTQPRLGVCYHDHLIRVGIMKRGITFPLILGHEGAGLVEAVGSHVSMHKTGDRVACMLSWRQVTAFVVGAGPRSWS